MFGSSKSWGLQQHPHPWHFRAGGGAVHSIKSGHSAVQQIARIFDCLAWHYRRPASARSRPRKWLRHLGGGVRLYWASCRRWPRAKIASRHAARIVRLGIVLVEAAGRSCCAAESTASRSPVWFSATAAVVEADVVSCGTTGSTASRSLVWLSGAAAL